MRRHREDSFGRHYLKHVALGEGCNCAESVIRTLSRAPAKGDDLASLRAAVRAALARVLRRLVRAG